MIAALGETTAGPALPRLRDIMLESAEGRKILKDRPRTNSRTVDMEKLKEMPENSFGRTYVNWLVRCGVTPDTREPVRFDGDFKSLCSPDRVLGPLYRGSRACLRYATLSRMS